jgi:DNA (cytosine-5)-methyltransferase 1
MTPTYGSLFSGVGGFDMGFDRAGYDCKWQVEWDKNCQQTLAHHWPDIPRYGDVQDVRGDQLDPVDVIIYGSPCQDLSVAGKRAGIEGGRSSMFFESVRIFKEMRDATNGTYPRIVVWENVAGALSSNRGEDFKAVLRALDDIGAVAQWWNVLDAQFFGVPQRRRRVFLISVFDPSVAQRVGSQPILSVGQGRRRNPKKVKQAGQDVAGTLGGGSGQRGWSPDTDRMTFVAFGHNEGIDIQASETVTPTLKGKYGGHAVMVHKEASSSES